MREIFEEETYLRFQLLFESAVSIAQAQVGLIPKEAASEINSKANIKNITVKRWREIEKITHHETASLVESIVEVVNTGAKPWVHYGLTSNDVLDTTLSLQLKKSIELIEKKIDVQIRITTPYEGYFYFMDNPITKLIGINKLSKFGLRGMTYIIGKTIVRVNITSKSDIESVFFGIDGVSLFYAEIKEPPYEWKIEKSVCQKLPLFGKHTINVHVWTKDKKIAYDEMDIFVLQFI